MSDDEVQRALSVLSEALGKGKRHYPRGVLDALNERDRLKQDSDRHYQNYLTKFKECEELKKQLAAAEIELARIRDISKVYLDTR